jgi:hypothetical protein
VIYPVRRLSTAEMIKIANRSGITDARVLDFDEAPDCCRSGADSIAALAPVGGANFLS